MRPEDAVEAARAEAARRRAAGGYAEPAGELRVEPTNQVTREKLLEWAVLDPDPDLVYSTRPVLGRPVTWVKRALMRGLRQYHGQLVSQQTRFNLQVVTYLARLEDRVERLERERDRP